MISSQSLVVCYSMINVESILKAPADPSNEESFVIVAATTCHVCNSNEVCGYLHCLSAPSPDWSVVSECQRVCFLVGGSSPVALRPFLCVSELQSD